MKSDRLSRSAAVLFLVPFTLAALTRCGKGEEQAAAPEKPRIPVVKVVKQDVPLNAEFVGQTKGAVDAEIRARVDGVLTGLHFEEGKEVKEGQLLYTIDPAPFEAKVAQAKGQLAEAQTKLVKAEADLKRVRPLVEMKALSERDLDTAVANEGAARGSLEAAEAQLKSAELELGYTKISAPISGIIGLTKARVGEYVGKPPNQVVLNTVSKLNPIHVRFSVSEKEYLMVARIRQKEIEEGKQAQKRVLQMVLSDGSIYPQPGEVASVDREIDSTTGTLMVEASFPNENELIRPGQFAKVKAVLDTAAGALLIPEKAIKELQGQYQVFIVNPDGLVESRTVKLGIESPIGRIVTEGIKEGEQVAVEGLARLKNGMNVQAAPIEAQRS